MSQKISQFYSSPVATAVKHAILTDSDGIHTCSSIACSSITVQQKEGEVIMKKLFTLFIILMFLIQPVLAAGEKVVINETIEETIIISG